MGVVMYTLQIFINLAPVNLEKLATNITLLKDLNTDYIFVNDVY